MVAPIPPKTLDTFAQQPQLPQRILTYQNRHVSLAPSCLSFCREIMAGDAPTGKNSDDGTVTLYDEKTLAPAGTTFFPFGTQPSFMKKRVEPDRSKERDVPF